MKLSKLIRGVGLTMVFVLSADASTIEEHINAFFKKISPERQKVIASLVQTDPEYKQAIEYLSNDAYMLKMPELTFHGKKIEGRFLPDCAKALPHLSKSFQNSKNTLSAYLGINCITNDAFTKKDTSLVKMHREFAEGLYTHEKSFCGGYMAYGDMLMHGIGGSPDYAKALKVFEEGKFKCSRFSTEWELRVLDTKIEQAKFKNKVLKK